LSQRAAYVARSTEPGNNTNTIVIYLAHLSAILHSNSGLVRLADRPYVLSLAQGPVLPGRTDGDGLLQYRDVPVGDYQLEIDGVRGSVPTVSNPAEQLPIRIRGYYIVPSVEVADDAVRSGADATPPSQEEESPAEEETSPNDNEAHATEDPDPEGWRDFDAPDPDSEEV